MKIYKIAAVILAVVLLLAGTALANESKDVNRDVCLTVLFRHDSAALYGAQFKLYRIADVDQAGDYTPVAPFDRYPVHLNDQSESGMAGVASALEGYVLRDKIAPAYISFTDQSGAAIFPTDGKMEQGLYLVLGDKHTANDVNYVIQPAIVQLPLRNAADDFWDYDVVINTKFETGTDSTSISRKVLKVWKNTEAVTELPKEVVIQLLRDGEVYDTVALNAENLWRHAWEELDADHHWTVVEKESANYNVHVTREGITFVVTNTYDTEDPIPSPTPSPTPPPDTPPSSDPKLPQTGQLWWPVPMLIALGLLLIVLGLFRRRGN